MKRRISEFFLKTLKLKFLRNFSNNAHEFVDTVDTFLEDNGDFLNNAWKTLMRHSRKNLWIERIPDGITEEIPRGIGREMFA